MIIGKYVRQLLDDRQRVVFPGFGNLEVKESAGEFPRSGKRINPPGLYVRFDPGFSKDDGLLASALASGEELTREESDQRVLELIDAIKFALDKGEPYMLPESGSFWMDEDGKIHFQTEPGWVLETDQYGLESIDLLELEELPLEEKKEADPSPDEEVERVSPVQKKVARVSLKSPEPLPVKSKRPTPVRWRVIWMVSGALIVILVVLIFIPADRNGDRVRKSRLLKKKPPAEMVQQDRVQPEEQKVEEVIKPMPDKPLEEPAKPRPATVEVPPNFFIIAGSFTHLKYASDLQDKLKAKGYQAEVMVTENRMYRVSIGSYATAREGERALIKFKTEPGLESCWLLAN